MRTLALDPSSWDLYLDKHGNIASLSAPPAIAQDVASAIRLFRGELYYNTQKGVPYLETLPRITGERHILGQWPSPPAGFLEAQFQAAALTVPGVQSVSVELDPLGPTRKITGRVTITDTSGAYAGLVAINPQPTLPWYVNAAQDGAAS